MRCDRCTAEGVPYVVIFDGDGQKEFVLCEKHRGPLERLKDLNYGTWKDPRKPRKRGIQKVDITKVPKKKS